MSVKSNEAITFFLVLVLHVLQLEICYLFNRKVIILALVVRHSIENLFLTNQMWFSVVCTLIDNDMHHHSQNVKCMFIVVMHLATPS